MQDFIDTLGRFYFGAGKTLFAPFAARLGFVHDISNHSYRQDNDWSHSAFTSALLACIPGWNTAKADLPELQVALNNQCINLYQCSIRGLSDQVCVSKVVQALKQVRALVQIIKPQ